MNSRRTIRLSQFFRLRIRPLVNEFPPDQDSRDQFIAAFFEAIGWLTEGVFCSYFDPGEADVLWVNLADLLEFCGSPDQHLVAPSLASEITRMYRSNDPFRASRQMPDGAQKAFELPLFPHALQISDRWANDPMASKCWSFVDGRLSAGWLKIDDPDNPVEPSEVVRALVAEAGSSSKPATLLGGFVHILEHMEVSRSFFDYARSKSARGSDFGSYCQRIGGLNAWRVPILNDAAIRRMDDLYNLLEFALRSSFRHPSQKADWSSVEAPIRNEFDSLLKSWETDHLIAFLQFA